MKIGELAQRVGVAPSTIRFYEASGLLPPAQRGANGYRAYDDDALQAVQMIQLAQRLGFSLDALRPILAAGEAMRLDDVLAQLDRRLAEIERMQAVLRRQRREVIALRETLPAQWNEASCAALNALPVKPPGRRASRR